MIWKIAAQFFLVLHTSFALSLVSMPALIALGYWQGWSFVHDSILRCVHLGFLGFVAVEAILGAPCPLMTWERACRLRAGLSARYSTGFFDYWVEKLLGITFRPWMFNSFYFVLCLIALLQLVWIPIRFF